MADWLVAGSLDHLLAQLNALAPRRNRLSDGGIGDPSHQTRDSDHNAWWILNGQRYVTARDFTHDPAGGLDCELLAESLRRGRDQRVKYVIRNRRIMAGAAGPEPWTWRPYGGSNPHTTHLHLSVVADARALLRIDWALPTLLPAAPAAVREDDDMTPAQAQMLAEIHGQLLGGWPTWDGGSRRADGQPDRFTPVDYLRKANQTGEDSRRDVVAVHAKLDRLLAAHGPATALTADDVRQILRDALDGAGPLYLTTKEPS